MFKNWEPDKWKHFYVGIPLGALLQAAAIYFIPLHPILNVLIAFLSLFLICYAFELVSLITGKGHYDRIDIVAGVLGGAIGIVIALPFLIFYL